MDFKTISLLGMGFLLVAMALSVLGLSADTIAFAHKHQHDDFQIHYTRWNSTAEAQYSYWLKMDYTPSRFTLGRESALLAGAVISAIAGAAVIATSWFARNDKPARFGLSSQLISFVVAGISFAISLAVTVYAWYPVMQWNINFLKSLPVPMTIAGGPKDSITYQSPFAFTPEYWNCRLAPYVADGMGGRLHSLCLEARAAKDIMIPIVILSAAVFILTGYSWWSAKTTVAEPEKEGKDVEEVSMASKD